MANSNTTPIITCAYSTFHGGSYARSSTTPLTSAQVYRFATEFCQPHVNLRGKGKVTTTFLLTVLFAAAARTSSIHETCSRLAAHPEDAARGGRGTGTFLIVDGATRGRRCDCAAASERLTALAVLPAISYRGMRRRQRRGVKPSEQRNLLLREGSRGASRRCDC